MRAVVIFLLLSVITVFAQSEEYFLTDPSLSPDGKSIVFSFESDLWIVPAEGGKAFRLTAMDGNEIRPVFSPDGNWIAFSSNQNGNNDVYVIPVNGGQIKQLTFHSAEDLVESWSWDSKYIYFNSNRFNSGTAFKVSLNGETPIRLFEHYFNWVHNLVEDPITKGFYFNDSWESSTMAHRKRYKGDFNPDVKYYNPITKEYKVLTNYRGKDFWQTVDKNGKIYFVSDEANDQYNLYTFENGIKKQLTDFDESIKRPRVSYNGEKVVFEKGYQLFVYDVKNRKSNKVDINIFSNYKIDNVLEFNTSGKVSNFAASFDGKKLAFISRGELFVCDAEGKFIKQVTSNSGERIVELTWLTDETLIYTQTVNGYLNLFMINVNNKSLPKQLTRDSQNNQSLTLSNDKTKLAYLSGRHELKVLNTKTFESKTILKDEFWALYPSKLEFSPDDRYLLYTPFRNFEQDILVYDFQKEKSFEITKTGVSEENPVWSPDGKYIYFASDRLAVNYPRGTEKDDIYRIALQNIDKEFKSDRFEKLFEPEKKDSSKIKVEIDFDGLKDRWEAVVSLQDAQGSPFVYQKGDETRILFVSNHEGDGNALYQTILKPFDKAETKKIEGAKFGEYKISKGKDVYYLMASNKIYKLDFAASKVTPIETEFKFSRNMAQEFKQMFYETWANVEENFYDNNFHGTDWNKVKKMYEKYLPFVKSRFNLRILLNDMLGELNSSHMGFSSTGDEEKTFFKNESVETGLMFEDENPFKVKYVVKNSSAYKKGNTIQPGDELVAINGNEIDVKENRDKYFLMTSKPDEITLTFKRGKEKYDVKIHPQTSAELKSNLYDEWVESNQKYVDEKSKNKIAYIHMKNMGESELNNFIIEMTNEAQYKDGLILDLRYNTGGNVHDAVLKFLSQRPYLNWKYRDGAISTQPNFAPAAKPIVVLINEQTLSDAEMTSAGFKQLGLGKIIGTESYRWIIFTSGKQLVDGSFYRLPSWGCFTLDGKDLEIEGVKPDIYVGMSFKDRLEKNETQLERAIEEIKKQLKD